MLRNWSEARSIGLLIEGGKHFNKSGVFKGHSVIGVNLGD